MLNVIVRLNVLVPAVDTGVSACVAFAITVQTLLFSFSQVVLLYFHIIYHNAVYRDFSTLTEHNFSIKINGCTMMFLGGVLNTSRMLPQQVYN